MTKTKHEARRCTICRDYARHERRERPLGDWTKRLPGGRKLHLYSGVTVRVSACGGAVRRVNDLWTLNPDVTTCKRCKKLSR